MDQPELGVLRVSAIAHGQSGNKSSILECPLVHQESRLDAV